MILQLIITPDLESRLRLEASRRGQREDETAIQLLDERLSAVDKANSAADWLLQLADEADRMSDEEAAENEAVLRAIDEDRLSDRKLFTDYLTDEMK
jgi:hypothetical protein